MQAHEPTDVTLSRSRSSQEEHGMRASQAPDAISAEHRHGRAVTCSGPANWEVVLAVTALWKRGSHGFTKLPCSIERFGTLREAASSVVGRHFWWDGGVSSVFRRRELGKRQQYRHHHSFSFSCCRSLGAHPARSLCCHQPTMVAVPEMAQLLN